MSTPITPERSTVRQYCDDLAKARQHRVLQLDDLALDRIGQRRQHFGEAERADQRRDQRDAAGELVPAEREAVVGIQAFLADLRDEAGRAAPISQPLSGSLPTMLPDIVDAEQREPEELEGAERQRDLGQRRREQRRGTARRTACR